MPALVGSLVMVLLAGCTQPSEGGTAGTSEPGGHADVVTTLVATTSAARAQLAGRQLSGASGDGAADGQLGTWRGTPVAIGGTWNDSLAAQTGLWTIAAGGEWGAWVQDLDIAVGAIYRSRGETWKQAAKGRYDARWRKSLTTMRALWGDRPGTLHIRFAHEFNGAWTPWYVTGKEAKKFAKSWRRYRKLQKQVLPGAKLVFSPNDGTSAGLRLDWRKAFPGKRHVDEMGVDSYNQFPFVTTAAAFSAKAKKRDKRGAPAGIESHRLYARSKGLPMAVPEWSTNAREGDGAAYIRLFSAWLKAHAGTGPGQVPYEILFNVSQFQDATFAVFPQTRMPQAAAAYRDAF